VFFASEEELALGGYDMSSADACRVTVVHPAAINKSSPKSKAWIKRLIANECRESPNLFRHSTSAGIGCSLLLSHHETLFPTLGHDPRFAQMVLHGSFFVVESRHKIANTERKVLAHHLGKKPADNLAMG
jgi:hypothetical protein